MGEPVNGIPEPPAERTDAEALPETVQASSEGTQHPPLEGAPPESRPVPSELDQITAKAVRYIKAKRGGDLAAILLIGSAARDSLLAHSDVNFVVLVRGAENRHEVVRIQDRIVEMRYFGLASLEEQLKGSLRLPATLRKARLLFEYENEGSQFLDQAQARFRQGAPALSLNDKIRLRSDALHWLGKAEDHRAQPAVSRYLFSIYIDECINAFYRLRGFWLVSPDESVKFITQRDQPLGELLQQALTTGDPSAQLELGRRIAEQLFKEIPAPARID
jgi:predicted nucleotidyltransferase